MEIPVFQIDSFTDHVFGGNPAAVCILQEWLDDAVLQNIAMEINLSETAFYVPNGAPYSLRWFSPKKEVRLCGHATLATAHVLYKHCNYNGAQLEFKTQSGKLSSAPIQDGGYQLDFPLDAPMPIVGNEEDIFKAVGVPFKEAYRGTDDYLLILESEDALSNANPNLDAIKQFNTRGLILSAKGKEHDFVSRCFYPNYGVDEDPVTGSAHTLLSPYWANKLHKDQLTACQMSERRGLLTCSLKGNRVLIQGQAKTTIIGKIFI